jgi:GxxExxY protein
MDISDFEADAEFVGVRDSGGLLHGEETYQIMGACFAVYNELGCGFLEAVYHEALSIELAQRAVPFVARQPLSIVYKGTKLKQGYAADFILWNKIILEIKAVTALCDEHVAQTMNYLKATNLELGLLVNFGHYPKLEYRRIVCTQGRYAR